MSLGKQLKHAVTFYLVRTFLTLFNIVPRQLALTFGAWIGLTAWWLIVKDQYKTERHLRLVFKERFTRRQRELIGRRFYVQSGQNYADVLRFARHFKNQLLPLIEVDGLEYFDDAYKRGRGVIGVTGHIGNYELLPVFLAAQGYWIGVIGRELYEPRMNELLVANRRACGLENFYTTDPPRRLLDWLQTGAALGVLIDTDSHRVRSEMLPFFNRPANTPIGQAVLAGKSGAALIPMACLRRPGNRYRILIRPEISVGPETAESDWPREATRLCNKELEAIIADFPNQWIWLHNRWHTSNLIPA